MQMVAVMFALGSLLGAMYIPPAYRGYVAARQSSRNADESR